MSFFDRLTIPITPVRALDHQAVTTTVNGEDIDIADADAINIAILSTAYVSGDATFKIEKKVGAVYSDLALKYVINAGATIGAIDKLVNIGINGLDDTDATHIRLVTVATVDMSLVAVAQIQKGDR